MTLSQNMNYNRGGTSVILLALEFTEYGLTHPEEHHLAISLRDKLLSEYGPKIKHSDFAVRERGKPYIKNSDISYSATHTEGCTGCAVSIPNTPIPTNVPQLPEVVCESGIYLADTYNGDCELGLDFERISAARDEARLLSIASRYFDEAELAFLRSAEDKCAAFYRFWTGKESLVKCTGEGLSALSIADTDAAAEMGFTVHEFTLVNGGKRFSGSLCRSEHLITF